jgi:predicted RNase H-like nuclease (RuvC/YqgF family)
MESVDFFTFLRYNETMNDGPIFPPEHYAEESRRRMMQNRIDALEHENTGLKNEKDEQQNQVASLEQRLAAIATMAVIDDQTSSETAPDTAA